MNPQQNPNPYDFILNSNTKPTSKLPFPKPDTSTKKGRILLVGLIAVSLIIVLIVLFSVIGSAGKAGVQALTDLANTQSEIIRVAKLSKDKTQNASTSTYAATVLSTVTSDRQAILKILSSNGKKLNESQLTASKNSKTDTALTTATNNNRFDEVFLAEINKELTVYQQSLKSRYNATSNKTEKQVLNDAYTHISTILTASTK